MVTVKAKFRASLVEGKRGVVYYQVIYCRVVRHIKTEYGIYPHEWSVKDDSIVIDKSTSLERTRQLKLIGDRVAFDIRSIYQLAKKLESRGRMNHCDDLIFEYRRQPQSQTFFNYFRLQIIRLSDLGRSGTANNYSSAFKSFLKFREGEDLIFDNITTDLMEEYEAHLKGEGVSLNTTSFYMRILRAVYNKAVDRGLVESQYPFKRVYTGVEKTVKRSLPLKDIKRIKEYDLRVDSECEYARDMFLFSFYTRGMSFIDMAYLRKDDIRNGVLIYRRRKTGQILHVRWERCMQRIVERYSVVGSIYLLPIIHDIVDAPNEYNLYKYKLSRVNNLLKRVSRDIGLTMPLTMYVARHSWASAARTKKIPISVISEGMGHDSEMTTQIYLSSIDTTIIDSANRSILKSL